MNTGTKIENVPTPTKTNPSFFMTSKSSNKPQIICKISSIFRQDRYLYFPVLQLQGNVFAFIVSEFKQDNHRAPTALGRLPGCDTRCHAEGGEVTGHC